jgi:hypothetical protein
MSREGIRYKPDLVLAVPDAAVKTLAPTADSRLPDVGRKIDERRTNAESGSAEKKLLNGGQNSVDPTSLYGQKDIRASRPAV